MYVEDIPTYHSPTPACPGNLRLPSACTAVFILVDETRSRVHAHKTILH